MVFQFMPPLGPWEGLHYACRGPHLSREHSVFAVLENHLGQNIAEYLVGRNIPSTYHVGVPKHVLLEVLEIAGRIAASSDILAKPDLIFEATLLVHQVKTDKDAHVLSFR